MSQIPPGQSNGWIDPYGQVQPGVPPPGYWQASDGRWYPPEAASADTQVVNPPAQQPFTPPSPGAQPHGGGYPGGGAQQGPPPYDTPSGQPSYDYGSAPSQFAPPGGQPSAAPGPYGGSPPGFTSPPQKKSRAGLIAALGALGLLVVGLVGAGIYAIGRGEDDNVATDETGTTESTSVDDTSVDDTSVDDTSVDDSTVGGTNTTGTSAITDDTTETTERTLSGVTTAPGAGEVGGGSGCEIIDDTTILVELVNDGPTTQSYFLTVGFFEGGARLGDTVAIVGNLRPGERTIEETFYFDQSGTECEILEVDGFDVTYDDAALADVSPCQITGVDTFGDIEGELTVTNSGSTTADYSVQLAFVDPAGIRRGSGFANVEAVRAGETAPTDVFTLASPSDGLICEVVGVDRTE